MGFFILKILLFIIWLLISYTIIKAFSSLAPWVPIFNKDINRAITLINLGPNEKFIDLGCGNGRLCFAVSKKTTGTVYGIELAWPLYVTCKIRQFYYNKKNIQFIFGNLFKINFADYNVLYIYGLPDKIKNGLSDKIAKEAKQGTRIISYCFEIPNLKLIKIDQPTKADLPIYSYLIQVK